MPLLQLIGFVLRTLRPRGRHLFAALLHRFVPNTTVRYRDRWGFTHTARFSDFMEALGFVGKPALADPVRAYVGTGDWVIDVGANVGIVTAELCRLVGPRGLVWAIEPFPGNALKLRALKEENRLSNLTVFDGALSSEPGVARLGVPAGGSSGHASLTRLSGVTRYIDVRTWRLDDLVAEADSSRRLAFIKIDIEGHEPALLAGASATLRRFRPAVLCEFNDALLRDGGSSSAQLVGCFAELGYRAIAAFKEGRPVRVLMGGAKGGPDRLPPRLDGLVVDLLLVAD